MTQITQERNVDVAQTASFSVSLDPCKMREMRIDRCGDNFGIQFLELIKSVRECKNLSWTNEGKVERVEEEDDIFSQVILQ